VSPASAAELVHSIVKLGAEDIEAVKRIEQWLEGAGQRPDAELAQLPDATRAHLELAALERLAAQG
jgi:hypothetical protein